MNYLKMDVLGKFFNAGYDINNFLNFGFNENKLCILFEFIIEYYF